MVEVLKDIQIDSRPGKEMPIYEQLASHLRSKINSDGVAVGMRLPAISEMMKEWDVAYPTIKAALELLEAENLIRCESGRGRGAVIIRKENANGYNQLEIGSKTISMLFCGLKQYITTTPIYTRLIYGMEKEAEKHGYNLITSSLKDTETFRHNDMYKNSAGFVALGGDLPGVRKLFEGKPFVWVMGEDKSWGDHLTYNNVSVGILAAKYVLSHNYKSFVSFDVDPRIGYERHDVFVNCVNSNGKNVLAFRDHNALVIGTFEQHVDIDVVSKWVDEVAEKAEFPAALFLSAELLVNVVHNLLSAKGLVVGKDVEIISCNGYNTAVGISPKPIAIDLCAEEIGRMAVNHLMWRLSNPNVRRIVLKLEPEIIGYYKTTMS